MVQVGSALLSIVLFYFMLCKGLGLLVINKGVRVNYTRKVGHFAMFLLPSLFFALFNIQSTHERLLLSAVSTTILFLAMCGWSRRRYLISQHMFASIDRPEDSPNTLSWLVSQTVVGLLVLWVTQYFWLLIGVPIELLYITILATTFGDGLAEPVGIRFGKHEYVTKGFFVDKKFKRTLEGSATVFVMSMLFCVLFKDYFEWHQFVLLCAVFPLALTLTEAKSPHTWDTPFLFIVGNAIVTGVHLL
jgi:Cytidylyltransferase family.